MSLCGFSGVGKTTTTRLIKAEEIPMQHVPTITGDIATIKIGKLQFSLWDFAGQEQFSYLWTNFIKGSDAVLLITDSTIENVEKSKFFLELIKEQAPNAHTAVIGNKQDLPDAMTPETIEKILGLKTYSMIANRAENREKMITIIADVLEMSANVSPLLKPLRERDNLTEEAKIALETGNFQQAVQLFEKIGDLCIDLGDDVLSKEFFNKAEKIKNMLEKASIEPPKVAEPPKVIRTPEIDTQHKDREKPIGYSVEPTITSKDESEKLTALPEKPMAESVEFPVAFEDENEKLTALPEKPKMKPPPTPPQLSQGSEGTSKLPINPEEFIVKDKPKQVLHVPKDAKNKLKTSAYGHVTNPTVEKPKPVESSTPFMKTEKQSLEQEKPFLTMPPDKPDVPETPAKPSSDFTKLPSKPEPTGISDQEQRDNIQKTLTDLKIKRANISKMSLDFEMKELTGEITKEEYDEKIKKLKAVEEKLVAQISELEKML
ncbi:MAG: ADP-ribosylation factor-like protein [Promethearchaeota archaeon]